MKEWLGLTYTIEKLLKEHELRKEIFQFEELVQALFWGAAKYGYMTGYQEPSASPSSSQVRMPYKKRKTAKADFLVKTLN